MTGRGVKASATGLSSSIWNAISLLTCCRIALPIALQGDLLRTCGSSLVREGEQPQSGCVRGGGVGLRAREIGARDMKCSFNIQRQLPNTSVIEPAKLYW